MDGMLQAKGAAALADLGATWLRDEEAAGSNLANPTWVVPAQRPVSTPLQESVRLARCPTT
jgi:hypothetical protein